MDGAKGLLHFRYRGESGILTSVATSRRQQTPTRVDVDLFPSLKLCVPSVQNGPQTERQAVVSSVRSLPHRLKTKSSLTPCGGSKYDATKTFTCSFLNKDRSSATAINVCNNDDNDNNDHYYYYCYCYKNIC